jgi:hypothetical protein
MFKDQVPTFSVRIQLYGEPSPILNQFAKISQLCTFSGMLKSTKNMVALSTKSIQDSHVHAYEMQGI